MLTHVVAEARRAADGALPPTVLTHPAGWGRQRIGCLTAAASAAGIVGPALLPEPVAAAQYFASALGRRVPPGKCLVVYDLGAGTFDVSVLRATSDGFVVVAVDGLNDVGGLDLDAVLVEHARRLTPDAKEAWGRLDWPRDTDDRIAVAHLAQSVRTAKEELSRNQLAQLHVPLVGADLHVTREEFETAGRPLLERTVALTLETLRAAAVSPAQVGGLFLVGGSSRVPLVATLLHRALGLAPIAVEQPDLVVAEGSVYQAAAAAPPPALDLQPEPQSETVAWIGAPVLARSFGRGWLFRSAASIHGLAVSPDGRLLAAASEDRRVRIWTLATGGLHAILTGHRGPVRSVAFSPDGRFLVSGGTGQGYPTSGAAA